MNLFGGFNEDLPAIACLAPQCCQNIDFCHCHEYKCCSAPQFMVQVTGVYGASDCCASDCCASVLLHTDCGLLLGKV